MGFLSKLFKKNGATQSKTGGMENCITLIRIYFQAVPATHLGISNSAMLPDLRTYKQTSRIPTLNNKLGPGEEASMRKAMKDIHNVDDNFFDEIDAGIKKNCKKMQDTQPYLYQFQGFAQGLMMLVGNLMKFELRVPDFFEKVVYMIAKETVNDVYDKSSSSDPGVMRAVMSVRQYNQRLGLSHKWATNFVYQVVSLAKKEPKPVEEAESK